MPTCFIFAQYLKDDGCLMLKLDDDGEEILPPQHYDFETIQDLQNNCKTILVYPSTKVSIFDLELPWLPDKKARAAIPYALEDRLSQPVELLHFAFDKKHYKNHHYEIAVMDKQDLQDLMSLLDSNNIDYNQIIPDWYALHPNEAACTGDNLLVYTEQFKGALSPELGSAFKNLLNTCEVFTFPDCKASIELPQAQMQTEPSTTWIAKRIDGNSPMNLCQGDLQHGTIAERMKKGYLLAAALGLVWLVSLIATNAFNLYTVNAETTHLDKQIASIYKQFFPDAKQVVSPKFRITQLLGNTQSQSRYTFWRLIQKFAEGIKNSPVKTEQLRFTGKSLFVTVAAPDFAALEKLENDLKKLQLSVNQTQAASREQQVIATLELK